MKNPGFRTYNYATQAARSPGSTIKPLVVYSPAVAEGWSTNKELDNSTTQYGSYEVNNYAGIQSRPNGTDVPGLGRIPQPSSSSDR